MTRIPSTRTVAMNRKVFFDSLRPHLNLTTQNVFGTERVIGHGAARGTPHNRLAYILATAWWETAQTMHPVEEAFWLSDDWRRRNLRYYPWHGRGLVQTTWRGNYERVGRAIGADLIADPDLLLTWEHALPALFVGMEKGFYTGRDLDDYIDLIDESDDEDRREYANARRIVNGTDRRATIAELALRFERALKASGYANLPQTAPAPADRRATRPKERPPPGGNRLGALWPWLLLLFPVALVAAFFMFA